MNLLITDDEMIVVKGLLAGIAWEECGITQVYTAYGAEDSRRVCEKYHIDILLCDIEMPGENGIELVRWVRENYPEIECLFLTCHAEFGYAQEAIHLGCSEYILKPALYTEIETAVRKLVDRLWQLREGSRLAGYGRQWIAEKKEKAELDTGKKMSAGEIAEAVETYVLGHLADEMTVEQIAGLVYLHPDYLSRVFKKEKGVSINKYIITERMKLAAHMLQDTDTAANTIALEVGYANYPNFVNMFKKVYGISPSQYREKHPGVSK